MNSSIKISDDGLFHFTSGALNWRNIRPTIEQSVVLPLGIEVTTDCVIYRLTEGRSLTVTMAESGSSLTLRFDGWQRAPFFVGLTGELDGASRFFRQGLGFSGPSGFVPLASEDKLCSHDSYLASAIVAADGSAVAFAAHDHANFLQRTTLSNRQVRRGLCNRHIGVEIWNLEVGFSTEAIPIDGGLELPAIHFHPAPGTFEALHAAACAIGAAMKARAHEAPRYHWCSWYDRGLYFTRERLQNNLDELGKISPPVPLQSVQIDDGYMPSHGDWLIPNHRWPGGLESAFTAIHSAGYTPGIWVAPFMVGCESQLFRDHPDWVLHDADGRPVPEWRKYDGTANDHETYALDASHPDARDYLRHVFRTLRGWGARFFKTDFLDWGLKDTARARRFNPDETSVQSFRKVMQLIREEIGEDSHWLACIAPFPPCLGFADSIRIANDVSPTWTAGGHGNMIEESVAGQYFNNVLWQNDPDVLYLRDTSMEMSEMEIRSAAYWQGILGGSINTSDPIHHLRPDRLALWRFLQPGRKWTAKLANFDQPRDFHVASRDYEELGSHAVFVLNPQTRAMTCRVSVAACTGGSAAFVFHWTHESVESMGRLNEIVVDLPPHGGALFYLNSTDTPPPRDLTLGGARSGTPFRT